MPFGFHSSLGCASCPAEPNTPVTVQVCSDFVEGAEVTIDGVTLTTDVDGIAYFSLTSGTDYGYSASAIGCLPKTGTITAGGAAIITLDPDITTHACFGHTLGLFDLDGVTMQFSTDGIGWNTMSLDVASQRFEHLPGTGFEWYASYADGFVDEVANVFGGFYAFFSENAVTMTVAMKQPPASGPSVFLRLV